MAKLHRTSTRATTEAYSSRRRIVLISQVLTREIEFTAALVYFVLVERAPVQIKAERLCAIPGLATLFLTCLTFAAWSTPRPACSRPSAVQPEIVGVIW